MVLRKIWSNKWMFLCLLLGAVLAVGMVASVPMYTEGVLNRMLRRDLELLQQRTGVYPGSMLYEMNAASFLTEGRTEKVRGMMQQVQQHTEMVPLPVRGEARSLVLTWLHGRRQGTAAEDKGESIKLGAQTDLAQHVDLVGGRLPATEVTEDGLYEVMMSRRLMHASGYVLDQVYEVADTRDRVKVDGEDKYQYVYKVKIVGVFEIAPTTEPYWSYKTKVTDKNLMMDYDLMIRDFVETPRPNLQFFYDYVAYDYQELQLANLAQATKALDDNLVWFKTQHVGDVTMPALELLQSFNNREQTLRTMLLVMQVPILIMLAFYIFMVTQLILEAEKGEIAILKSRGAGRGQIMLIYLLESLLVSGIAFVCGPLLGYGLCSVLGASNGFMEFVSRRALPVQITGGTLSYALVAAAAIALMILVPAFFASRVGIVEQKRERSKKKIALWKKTGIDFMLLALAGYGWYSYQLRQTTLALTGGASIDVPVDPLLFLLSTAFIMGAGLLFLRFYPLFIRGIYALGKKAWPPALYASFVQVGRSGGQEQFLMLFLIITLSLGIFSANSANTININVEEKIYYKNGADLVLQPMWRSNKQAADPAANSGMPGAGSTDTSTSTGPQVDKSAQGYANQYHITYVEPPFEGFTALEGIEHAAKVFINEEASFKQPGKNDWSGTVMAIEPAEFGKVAYMPNGLLRPHWYDYLNLLAQGYSGALISRDYAEGAGISPGDSITVRWSEQNPVSLTVYAIIDYWPTYNPMGENKNLVVCNLDKVRSVTALEPYQVWCKRAEGVSSAQIYEEIAANKLAVESITDSSQMLIEAKNDPMLQGTNGALTMSFIVTMVVSFFGFIIYWVLSIRGRELQFGVLRAMGMGQRSIIGMLLWEQLLISGVAIVVGIVLGGVTAQIFAPLLQMVYDAADQVPPFRVVANRADYEKIYAIIAVMLGAGFAALGVMISRIRITQALKLGED